jgi:hypothetical protein
MGRNNVVEARGISISDNIIGVLDGCHVPHGNFQHVIFTLVFL